MRWYVGANSDRYASIFAAGLRSAAMHSDVDARIVLHPQAQAERVMALARRYNGSTIVHEVLFAGDVTAGASRWNVDLRTSLGTFVRCDMPLLAAAETLGKTVQWVSSHLHEAAVAMASRPAVDNAILYTDSDVLFLGPVTALLGATGGLQVPPVHAVTPDFNLERPYVFNSGVMLINVSGWLDHYAPMLASWRAANFSCMTNSFDQGCLQAYTQQHSLLEAPSAQLPPGLHWRTYRHPHELGVKYATILHYHMPKPADILELVNLKVHNSSAQPIFSYPFGLNPEGYLQALALYFLHEDPETPLEHPIMRNFVPAYDYARGVRLGHRLLGTQSKEDQEAIVQ
jgi:hypothetical protein